MADNEFKVTFTFDKAAVKARVDAARDKGIEKVAIEAMKDCDPYTPALTGTFKKTVLFGSEPKKGRLVWKAPQARRLWYGIKLHFSTAMNAEAQAMWAIKAYHVHKDKYEKMLKDEVKKGV